MQLALFDLNVNWTVSRTTPTVPGDLLIVRVYDPSVVIAVKRTSGELVRKTTLDNHPAALITVWDILHRVSVRTTSHLYSNLGSYLIYVFKLSPPTTTYDVFGYILIAFLHNTRIKKLVVYLVERKNNNNE